MYLSVIIPAYNEARRIGKTLRSVHEYLHKQSYDYEVLVVSDGSTDETVRLVRDMTKKVPHLRVIDNRDNHGKGWVVRQGMQEARGEYRLFMDADNSTSVDQVEKMLPFLEKDYDIVIGSRRIKGAKIAVHQGLLRDLLGSVFRLIVHTLVPLRLTDSQAGFKIFSKKAVDEIFPHQTVFRWAFDVELLAIARLRKLQIKEAPITWRNDSESKVRITGMINMLFELVRIRLNLWDDKYARA